MSDLHEFLNNLSKVGEFYLYNNRLAKYFTFLIWYIGFISGAIFISLLYIIAK